MRKKILFVMCIISLCIVTGCAAKPAATTGSLQKGLQAVASQEYMEALSCFEQAMLEKEDMEQVYRGMGLAYMGMGEYRRAVNAFQDALSYADMFPGALEYDINYYMAVAYYKLEEYDSAIAVYDAIIDLNPKDENAYFLRGSMKMFLSDVEGAIADFDTAVDLDAKNYGLYIDIYECMKQHGKEADAQKYLDVVLAVSSDEISDYDKGRLCYFQGEYAQGCNYLERARSEGNATAELITLLGECYQSEGKYEYAAVVYSSYVTEHADPLIYNQLGLCYVEQGDFASALSAFQAGIAIKENNTCIQVLRLNEIACYEYLLDFDSAEQKLAEYLAIYPADELLEKEYAFLTTR